MNIEWPYVRQILLNDRINGYKPDRACLDKVANLLPGVKFLGFGRYYQFHWYLIIESSYFPYSIEELPSRGAVPLTAIINDLAKRRPA